MKGCFSSMSNPTVGYVSRNKFLMSEWMCPVCLLWKSGFLAAKMLKMQQVRSCTGAKGPAHPRMLRPGSKTTSEEAEPRAHPHSGLTFPQAGGSLPGAVLHTTPDSQGTYDNVWRHFGLLYQGRRRRCH